ncbi:MAG: succinylglutamate desuccinylase/aspartoacylase family protein, partial [Pseudomonadota bacterium]
VSIRVGVRGVLNVMRKLGMLPARKAPAKAPQPPFVAHSSAWVRAPGSGIFRAQVKLGQRVKAAAPLGVVSDAFGAEAVTVTSPFEGIIIGCTNLPLVHEGEALYHIGQFERPKLAAEHAAAVQQDIEEGIVPPPGTIA